MERMFEFLTHLFSQKKKRKEREDQKKSMRR